MEQVGCDQALPLLEQKVEAVLTKAKSNDDFRRETLATYCCQKNPSVIMIHKLMELYPLEELDDPEYNACIYSSEIATMELFRLLLALDDGCDDPAAKALTSIGHNCAAEACHLAKAASRGYMTVLELVAKQAPEAFFVRHDRYGTVLRQALSEVEDNSELLPNGGFLSSPAAMQFIIEQYPEAEQAEITCLLQQRSTQSRHSRS